MTKSKRNRMIRALNNDGFSVEEIYGFMQVKPLSIRTIQTLSKPRWHR